MAASFTLSLGSLKKIRFWSRVDRCTQPVGVTRVCCPDLISGRQTLYDRGLEFHARETPGFRTYLCRPIPSENNERHQHNNTVSLSPRTVCRPVLSPAACFSLQVSRFHAPTAAMGEKAHTFFLYGLTDFNLKFFRREVSQTAGLMSQNMHDSK